MNLDYSETMDKRLSIVRELFDTLHQKEISYCHWKSNEHVGAAVRGDTDLDILFDNNKYEETVKTLIDSGFRYFKTPWYRSYPGIEDYLAIDSETGRLVHIHAHFKLVLGEKGVKEYHLEWEKEILESRVWDQSYRIYCIQPAREMLLLLIRLALRRKNRSDWNKKSAKSDLKNFQREFTWLKEKVTFDELKTEIGKKIGQHTIPQFSEIYHQGLHPSFIPRLQEIISQAFQKERMYGGFRTSFIKHYRVMAAYLSKVCFKFGIDWMPRKRIMPKRGLIVSFMGADGSGKTTQTRLINQTLYKKIDTKLIYMGSGAGSISIQRRIMKKLLGFASIVFARNKRRNTKNSSTVNKNQSGTSKKRPSFFSGYATCLRAWSIAKEKKTKLKQAIKVRDRGYIVLCDRYPQNTILGFNDGPLISEYRDSKNILLKKLAEYEDRVYSMAASNAPDIVIKLIGDANTLYNRKPEMPIDRVQLKQEGFQRLSFPEGTLVAEVDATQSIEEVKKAIMKHIGKRFI